MNQELQDSGERREFKSGAVRDRGTLKPRPDLISPHAAMREGMIFALGAEKYAIRNWELGMPISECLASTQRHIEQYKRGDTDEDHLAQARWNLGAMIHFEEEIKAGRLPAELDDMPRYAAPKPGDDEGPISVGGLAHEIEEFECEASRKAGQIFGTEYYKDKLIPDGNCYYCEDPPNCTALHPCSPECETRFQQDMNTPTFYVCGPMTGIKHLNFPLFDRVAEIARAEGLYIINPAELDREQGIDPVNDPGCVERARAANPNLIQIFAQRDLEVIFILNKDRGDGLILLPGWQKSTGARAEISLALWLGLEFKAYIPNSNILLDISMSLVKNMLFHQGGIE